MQKTSYCSGRSSSVKKALLGLLLACAVFPAMALCAPQTGSKENLSGFYAREGNNDSPAKTAGNNIYLKFFEDRWVGMMFIPYPDAGDVGDEIVARVFAAARIALTCS